MRSAKLWLFTKRRHVCIIFAFNYWHYSIFWEKHAIAKGQIHISLIFFGILHTFLHILLCIMTAFRALCAVKKFLLFDKNIHSFPKKTKREPQAPAALSIFN
jgi:hypothetical protein